jgi:prepilin-type N-terminal cleavage/methylation domain-containing protein
MNGFLVNMKKIKESGFTLIELLVVIAIIGTLASVMVVLIKPGRQLAKVRDTGREAELIAILAAVFQYAQEHSGDLPDTDGDPETSNFPTSPTCIGNGVGCFDLASAGEDGDTIVPVYLAQIPSDPRTGNPPNDTGYTIWVDENNRLVASASGETRMIIVTQ